MKHPPSTSLITLSKKNYIWHMTRDMLQIRCWGGGHYLKWQVPYSYGFGAKVFKEFEEKVESLSQLIRHRTVCGIYSIKQTWGSRGLSKKNLCHSALTDLFSNSSFVTISSNNLHSETIRARVLKFWEEVPLPLPLPVICHASHIICYVSHVTCHLSIFFSFFFMLGCYLFECLLSTGPTPSSFNSNI